MLQAYTADGCARCASPFIWPFLARRGTAHDSRGQVEDDTTFSTSCRPQDALVSYRFVVGCCSGHGRVALHMVLHSASFNKTPRKRANLAARLPIDKGSPSSNLQITAISLRFLFLLLTNTACFLNNVLGKVGMMT